MQDLRRQRHWRRGVVQDHLHGVGHDRLHEPVERRRARLRVDGRGHLLLQQLNLRGRVVPRVHEPAGGVAQPGGLGRVGPAAAGAEQQVALLAPEEDVGDLRALHDAHPHRDPDGGEVGLDRLGVPLHVRAGGHQRLEREPVRQARLREQLRVVRVGVGADGGVVGEAALRHRLRGQLTVAAGERVHEGLPVDRVPQRLPHPHVAERRALPVGLEVPEVGDLLFHGGTPFLLAGVGHRCRRRASRRRRGRAGGHGGPEPRRPLHPRPRRRHPRLP